MDFSKKPQQKSLNEGASPISRLFLLWMAPLLWKGMKNGLTQNDLTKCMPKDRSDVLGDNLEREWKRELEMATKCQRKPRLWRALLRLHLLPLVGYGFLQFLDNFVLRTLRTPVLRQLIAQFQKPTNKISIMNGSEVDTYHKFSSVNGFAHHMWNDSFWLATILISMTFITALVNEHSYYGLVKLGPRMRASCCSLLYRKSLRLSTFEANQTSSGYVVNLVSNDLARLDDAVFYIHYIWIFPSQIIFVVYLIWEGAQWAAILGVIALLLQTIPFHTISSYFITALFRHKVALLSDNRIGIMNELIHGIQLIKMYAWELPFRKIVAEARRLEIKQIRYASYIQSMGQSTMDFVGRSTLFISIAAYVIMGYRISADLVYSLAQYFQLLQLGACAQYPLALSNGAEALVSLKRIEEFLLKKEKNETELGVERRNCSTHSDENTDAIEINGVSASWDEKNAVKTLKQITLKIKPGQLCTIAGPVGEGKSSLIQLLLGELPVQSGNVVVNGSISYAAQEPWIFFGTVRNNILFGQTYDKNRYSEVVECCALTKDFEQLPLGDRTVISDRGASLSGGQRIRISLARAIYKMASIYLFDDPLSAVDAPVSKHLFDHVIGPNARLAKNATRILITHNVHFLKEADVIVVMENGQITYHGTYANLSESDVDFAKLLQRTDRNDGKKNEESQQILGGDTVACENSENTLHVGQILNGEDDIGLRRRSKSIASIASQHFEHLQIDEEEKAEAKIWRIILYYLLAGTGWCGILFMFLINICTQMMLGGCDYYVNYFINQESKRKTNAEGLLTQMEYLYIYAAIIIAIISIGILRGVYFFQICMRSSKVLHDKMFRNIMEAPISFFTTNPSGRILNRFSNDMGIIDEFMPCVMFASLQSVTGLIGIVVLILIVNPAMIWAFLVSMILFLLIIKLFTRSSQDLRRLEGICRSPILSHLTASISGRTTIRTRGIERKMCQEFDELQDVHSSVWQLSRIACEAFGLWAHCLCAMFLASLIFSYIFIYQNSSSEDVGLAISQCLMLTTYLVNGLQQTLSLIQQTTSVERIAQYTEIDPEMGPTKRPPIEWPNNGKIKMQNMSLHYNLKDPPILKRITLDIQPGSKIGVVGRTGAGKSSLIAALFRLAHIEGLIEIDGIDTGTIALDSLRSKISIIPQDPVLFSGTIRRNLDPFEEYSDDDIWKTLDDVQLKEIVTFAGGLNMQVMASGINLSVGQRQLVCLARAILRNNCILVIDEATANVDIRTDQMIQRTIRDKFADCTVLTVAHRLNTIIDSDRILVMDAGECVAFDTPFNLLNKSVLCA